MTTEYKNRHKKISVTDKIQIRKNASNCTIELIDKTTGETAELTDATLECIIRNNNMYDRVCSYITNDSIINHLIKEYQKYEQQQKALKEVQQE